MEIIMVRFLYICGLINKENYFFTFLYRYCTLMGLIHTFFSLFLVLVNMEAAKNYRKLPLQLIQKD